MNVSSLLITISFCLEAQTNVCGLDFEKKSPSAESVHVLDTSLLKYVCGLGRNGCYILKEKKEDAPVRRKVGH